MEKLFLYLRKSLLVKTNLYIIVIYIICGIFLIKYFQYSFRGDIISYISISEKFISGNFNDAINGVWSPLLSFLLMPVILLKIPIFLGLKIIHLAIGTIILFVIIRYSNLVLARGEINNLSIYLSIVILMYYLIFFLGSPDLLVAGILLIYLFLLTSDKYLKDKKYGIYCGLIAAMAFYAKAYTLPFFIAHYLIINIYYLVKNPEKKALVLSNYLKGSLTFYLTCSIWVILLSLKYGYFTYSTAGNYNFNIVGPQYEFIHTFRIEKLYPPPNSTAVSYWEDPTSLPIVSWSPFSSVREFQYAMKNILKNLILVIYYFFTFSPFFFILIFFCDFKKSINNSPLVILLITIIIYTLGYVLLFIQPRYLILPHFLLIIFTFGLLNEFIIRYNIGNKIKYALYGMLLLSVTIQSIYSLTKYANEGQEYFEIAQRLRQQNIQGNFAGLSSDPLEDDWATTLFFAYETQSKFFGEASSNQDEKAIYNELKDYNIDFLFDWTNNDDFKSPELKKILDVDINQQKTIDIGIIDKLINKIFSVLELKRGYRINKKLRVYQLRY